MSYDDVLNTSQDGKYEPPVRTPDGSPVRIERRTMDLRERVQGQDNNVVGNNNNDDNDDDNNNEQYNHNQGDEEFDVNHVWEGGRKSRRHRKTKKRRGRKTKKRRCRKSKKRRKSRRKH
jgi:hypothetical protein